MPVLKALVSAASVGAFIVSDAGELDYQVFVYTQSP